MSTARHTAGSPHEDLSMGNTVIGIAMVAFVVVVWTAVALVLVAML